MLVQVDDFLQYLGGIALEAREAEFVERFILPGIQQQLESYLNRPVEPVQVREPRRPDWQGNVLLSVTPVWKVISIDYTGQSTQVPGTYTPGALTPDSIADRVLDLGLYPQSGTPYMQPVSSVVNVFNYSPLYTYSLNPANPPYVWVNYIGGWNGYTEVGLQLAIMRVAARETERMFDDTLSLRAGSAEVTTLSDIRLKGWSPEELMEWDRLRRPVVAT